MALKIALFLIFLTRKKNRHSHASHRLAEEMTVVDFRPTRFQTKVPPSLLRDWLLAVRVIVRDWLLASPSVFGTTSQS